MNAVMDKLEDLLLLALDGTHTASPEWYPEICTSSGRTKLVCKTVDAGTTLKFLPMVPKCAYTHDATDRERVFAGTPELLMTPPQEIIGDSAEAMWISTGHSVENPVLDWFGYRRMSKKAQRGLFCMGKAAVWYEVHARHICYDGAGVYYKRAIALDAAGNALITVLDGTTIASPSGEGRTLCRIASLIEDTHRTTAMRATLSDAIDIRCSVPIADYKQVFALRDGPIIGNRRKAIVHWVMQHLRKTPSGGETDVKKHTRGVTEIVVDGLTLRIEPNK